MTGEGCSDMEQPYFYGEYIPHRRCVIVVADDLKMENEFPIAGAEIKNGERIPHFTEYRGTRWVESAFAS